MSFNRTRWSRQTLADNTGAVTLADASVVNGPAVFTYKSTADALATIAGANYFSAVAFDLAVGDYIFATGSDGSNMYIVATVDRSVSPATITVESFTASGSVATANIQDGAVTTAKLAADAVTNAKLADDAVSLENLDDGIAPSHVIKFASQATTVGGAAAEAFTVTGVAATDLAFVQIVNDGTSNVTVLQAVCTLNTLTVTFSANPLADTVFNYQIIRAAA